jgi:cytoskeletal protein RodZ
MGAYLRAARRKRRVSIERAAEETRIRPDFLMRMESDEFDFLAPTYVRGFLRSYARYLHADPEPLMKEFDARFGTGRVDTAQIAALDRRNEKSFSFPGRKMSSWKLAAVITGAVLLILAVVGIFHDPKTDHATTVANVSPSALPSPVASPSVVPSGTPSPAASPSDSGKIAFDNGIDLVIEASKGDCWISIQEDGRDVTGAGGRLMAQGEQATFKARKKIEMRLGYPQGVDLIVNGQNIGSPGGSRPINLVLPDDIASFRT